MKTPVAAALAATLVLAGCGGIRESRLNPFNWFGRSTEAPATLAREGGPAAQDGRALVAEVTRMEVKRMPGGAIVSAAGLPPTQGWWDAELVSDSDGVPDGDGTLVLRFVVAPPPVPMRVSTPQSRELTAAYFLSDAALAPIRRIVVLGAQNSRASGR